MATVVNQKPYKQKQKKVLSSCASQNIRLALFELGWGCIATTKKVSLSLKITNTQNTLYLLTNYFLFDLPFCLTPENWSHVIFVNYSLHIIIINPCCKQYFMVTIINTNERLFWLALFLVTKTVWQRPAHYVICVSKNLSKLVRNNCWHW